MAEQTLNLKDAIKNLKEIVEWFDRQKDIDIEVSLEKVKEGTKLVKLCKKRLLEIENEFEEIQKDMTEE